MELTAQTIRALAPIELKEGTDFTLLNVTETRVAAQKIRALPTTQAPSEVTTLIHHGALSEATSHTLVVTGEDGQTITLTGNKDLLTELFGSKNMRGQTHLTIANLKSIHREDDNNNFLLRTQARCMGRLVAKPQNFIRISRRFMDCLSFHK